MLLEPTYCCSLGGWMFGYGTCDLGAVHKLCRLKIGDFWPPPTPLLVVFLLWKSTIFDPPLLLRRSLWTAPILGRQANYCKRGKKPPTSLLSNPQSLFLTLIKSWYFVFLQIFCRLFYVRKIVLNKFSVWKIMSLVSTLL